jgi:hypothetical protein
MATERLGIPLSPEGPDAILRDEHEKEPGFGWVLSDPAKRAIDAIEENLRSAEQRTGSIVLR